MEVKMDMVEKAMANLEAVARECAKQIIGDKICWHGEDAVTVALIQYMTDNLVDNFHDGPDFYEETVSDILGRGSFPG
jgi:hypothetical protein